MRSPIPYYPNQPAPTFVAHIDWFNATSQWEYPYASRPEYNVNGTPEQVQWYKQQRLEELCYHIERVLVFRCLPLYKKIDGRSRMWSAEITFELWTDFVNKLKAQCEPEIKEKKKFDILTMDSCVKKNKLFVHGIMEFYQFYIMNFGG